jgi:hypothetical protein
MMKERKELSYLIDVRVSDSVGAIRDMPGTGGVLSYDMLVLDSVTGRRIPAEILAIWFKNSGGLPLKDLPVAIHFTGAAPGDPVLGIRHVSFPFAPDNVRLDTVTVTRSGSVHSFRYELLNPGDEVLLVAVVKDVAGVSVYSRSEKMRLRRLESRRQFSLARPLALVSLIALGALTAGAVRYVNWPALARRTRKAT